MIAICYSTCVLFLMYEAILFYFLFSISIFLAFKVAMVVLCNEP